MINYRLQHQRRATLLIVHYMGELELCTQKLCIISYKAWIFTNTTMRTLNLPAATMLSFWVINVHKCGGSLSARETAIKSHNYCCCCCYCCCLFLLNYFSYEESSWEDKSVGTTVRLKKSLWWNATTMDVIDTVTLTYFFLLCIKITMP